MGLNKDLFTALILIGLLVVVGFWLGVGLFLVVEAVSRY